MAGEKSPLQRAQEATQGLVEHFKREISRMANDQDPQALSFKENATWLIKGLDLALDQMRIAMPKAPVLESYDVQDTKIKKIVYNPEMCILELQMIDGVIRWHEGVDRDTWHRVKSLGSMIEAYYMYIHDKIKCSEQYPDRLRSAGNQNGGPY